MTKEEIYERIQKWIFEGKLLQKSDVATNGGYWYGIWKRVSLGELFFTGCERVVASDVEVRDEFQRLVDEHRVMSVTDVTIRHPECKTVYDIEKLVKSGQILKMCDIPKVKLYIE